MSLLRSQDAWFRQKEIILLYTINKHAVTNIKNTFIIVAKKMKYKLRICVESVCWKLQNVDKSKKRPKKNRETDCVHGLKVST